MNELVGRHGSGTVPSLPSHVQVVDHDEGQLTRFDWRCLNIATNLFPNLQASYYSRASFYLTLSLIPA